MSEIVWTLVVALSGWYGTASQVTIDFKSERECEAAKLVVKTPQTSQVKNVYCEPRKKTLDSDKKS